MRMTRFLMENFDFKYHKDGNFWREFWYSKIHHKGFSKGEYKKSLHAGFFQGKTVVVSLKDHYSLPMKETHIELPTF